MTPRAVAVCQPVAVVYSVHTVSEPVPAGHRDMFALVNSAALGDLYERPVFVSPPFVRSIEALVLHETSHHVFIPETVLAADEGVIAFLNLNGISYTEVACHDELKVSIAALAPEKSAVLLFCTPSILSPELECMVQELTTAGFMENDVVRSLNTIEAGVCFVQKLASILPAGWDLIDACELLDFGPWEEEKGINASLRCMGMRGIRKDDETTCTRMGILSHPIQNRAGSFMNIMYTIKRDGLDAAKERFQGSLMLHAQRLAVEAVFVLAYLKSKTGLQRFAEGTNKYKHYECLNLIDRMKILLESIREFLSLKSMNLVKVEECLELARSMHQSLRSECLTEDNMVRLMQGVRPEDFMSLATKAWNLS